MIIQISGQYGDSRCTDLFFPLQKKLNDLFKKHISGEYFHTITRLSIVFRVSGKVQDFISDGPERLKYLKKDSELTIDLVFPENKWLGVEKEIIKKTVKQGVVNCLILFLEKAEKLGEMIDKNVLNHDIEKVFFEY